MDIAVKGRGPKPVMEAYYHFPGVMFRAYGEKTIAVEGGRNIYESIEMFPAVEAANIYQLFAAFNLAWGNKEYVFITNSIRIDSLTPFFSDGLFVSEEKNIELRAEKKVTIERFSEDDDSFSLFTIWNGGTLTLGKEGETNQYLQISGDITVKTRLMLPMQQLP